MAKFAISFKCSTSSISGQNYSLKNVENSIDVTLKTKQGFFFTDFDLPITDMYMVSCFDRYFHENYG